MKQEYIIGGWLILVAFLLFFGWNQFKQQTPKSNSNSRRPSEKHFPKNKITNDKMVVIDDINENDVTKIIQDFCDSYNQKSFQILPTLSKLSDKKFAVTFPYNVNFVIYCYFINYMNYPEGYDKQFKTVGWTTTRSTDTWITDKSANKKVMLFVYDLDTEYDNVFMTTVDNIGYKLGFAMGQESQLLNHPIQHYIQPLITPNELQNKELNTFK